MNKTVLLTCFLLVSEVAIAVAPNAVSDPTTQPDVVTGCNLYKGISPADAGKKALVSPSVTNSPLVSGGCKVSLENLLVKGEKTTMAASFINARDSNESVLSNVITVSRPADPPASPWTGAAIDTANGLIFANSFPVANQLATNCSFSIDNAAYLEVPLVKRDSFYSVCKIPLSGSGKHILYYSFINNSAWGRLEGKKTGFAYTLPTCQ